MEWLFSWEVSSWIVGIAIAVGFVFVSLDDFKLAKLFFLIAAADAAGGMLMWGFRTQRPLWQLIIAVFVLMGGVGALTVLLFRYVDHKQINRQLTTGPSSKNLVCQVMAASFELHLYRFYQFPPVYFQRLDTMLRVSLTNQTGKPLYIRGYSVAALVGIEWVQFKNADSAAFEPYAFGVMGSKNGKGFIRRFDLSENGFDYVMQQRSLEPDQNLELWMFFISGLSHKDQANISQFKFVFYDRANEEFPCISAYTTKNDKGTVVGTSTGDLKALDFEPIPPNLREEPPH